MNLPSIHNLCSILAVGGLLWEFAGPIAAAKDPAPPTVRAAVHIDEADLKAIAELPKVPPGLNGDDSLLVRSEKRVTATLELVVRAPNLSAERWLVFAAKPLGHSGQSIHRVRTTPSSRTIHDLSPRAQPLLITRYPVKSDTWRKKLDYTVEIEAELFSRRLTRSTSDRPTDVPELSDAQRTVWLLPAAEFDYQSPEFAAWLKRQRLSRGETEGEIAFARRVFQAIAQNFSYEYLGQQDRHASHVCQVAKSDCGGMAITFVSALRSQGIPARILVGRWAISAKRTDEVSGIRYTQEHVKAEFFAQGVGWIPVDPSSAVLHDRSPAKLRYFGNDSGDFLTFHFDTALSFDTHYFGVKTMKLMQKPAYWASGSGNFKEVSLDETWQVR